MSGSALARGGAVIVEEPLEFTPMGELIYVTDPVTGTTQAFRRQTFSRTFYNAALCMQQLHGLETAEILPFRRETAVYT